MTQLHPAGGQRPDTSYEILDQAPNMQWPKPDQQLPWDGDRNDLQGGEDRCKLSSGQCQLRKHKASITSHRKVWEGVLGNIHSN